MIRFRPSADRGHFDHGWLDTFHTFSFGDYFDRQWMAFRSLRVINEDRVAGGGGFGTHPHRDMEIITVILEGALEHKDSLGSGSVIRPGDVQRMSAGTGIEHSEFNHSKTEPVHLLQIWILPERKGLPPSYEEKNFNPDEFQNKLRLIASRNGRNGSVTIHQDADIYSAKLDSGKSVQHELKPLRHAWLQVARGKITLNGQTSLNAGDGASINEETSLKIVASEPAELLLFDLE